MVSGRNCKGVKMVTHVHEAELGLDKSIRCRECGEILDTYKEEICKVSSASRVRKILEEIAVSGGYSASGFENGFVVFSTVREGLTEEVNGEKVADRVFRVYKRIRSN